MLEFLILFSFPALNAFQAEAEFYSIPFISYVRLYSVTIKGIATLIKLQGTPPVPELCRIYGNLSAIDLDRVLCTNSSTWTLVHTICVV